MRISPEKIIEFQKLYKEQFKQDITPEEAYEKGMILLRLMKIIYQPMTKKELNIILDRKKNLK